jgi:orotate phosphoribosyltransferase
MNILEEFEDRGVILRGHFLLTSGLHSEIYFEKFRILEDPAFLDSVLKAKVEDLRKLKAEAVAGPTTGGALVAHALARLLGIKAVFAEKEDDKRVFRRNFSLSKGTRVLIADDVVTTGGSLRKTIEATREKGWIPVGIFVIVNRSGKVDFEIPFFTVLTFPVETWTADACPLCKRRIPLSKPGGR